VQGGGVCGEGSAVQHAAATGGAAERVERGRGRHTRRTQRQRQREGGSGSERVSATA
jgi:hypothetical protein